MYVPVIGEPERHPVTEFPFAAVDEFDEAGAWLGVALGVA
jgi:hypothetical protein